MSRLSFLLLTLVMVATESKSVAVHLKCERYGGWLRGFTSDPLLERDCANVDYSVDLVIRNKIMRTRSHMGLVFSPLAPAPAICPRLLFRLDIERKVYRVDDQYGADLISHKSVLVLDNKLEEHLVDHLVDYHAIRLGNRTYLDVISAMKQTGLSPEEELGHYSVLGDTEAIIVARTIGLLRISPSKRVTKFTIDRFLQVDLRWKDISRVLGGHLVKGEMMRRLVGRYQRNYSYKEDGDNQWLYLDEQSPIILDCGHCKDQGSGFLWDGLEHMFRVLVFYAVVVPFFLILIATNIVINIVITDYWGNVAVVAFFCILVCLQWRSLKRPNL